MHTEHICSREVVYPAHPENIIAVGTTSVRTLESLYWMGVKRILGDEDFSSLGQWEAYDLPSGYSLKESMTAFGWVVLDERR